MESSREILELDIQRASILSDGRFSKNGANSVIPQDKYYIAHFVFFLFGMGSILSMTFFMTANDYWMYKFRDVSQETYNSTNKTTLQTYFASYTGIVQTVTSLAASVVTAILGHKISIKVRTLGTLTTMSAIYALFTCMIKVNTDSWQELFFGITLIFYAVLAASTVVLGLLTANLIAKFPPQYNKIHMYGQSFASLFSSTLQIISLSIGGTSTSAALIYFICGTMAVVLTLICGIISNYSSIFKFYLGDTVADTKRKLYTFADMKRVAKKTWPCIYCLCLYILAIAMSGSVTYLIVSENYGNGKSWNNKYFMPVMTFLLPEIVGLLGKFLGIPLVKGNTKIPFIVIYTIRTILLGPIYLFCNAVPRQHIPIWFPHDWEYGIIVAVYSLTNSFVMACVGLSIPKLAGPDTEIAFILFQTIAMSMATLISFLSPLVIKLL